MTLMGGRDKRRAIGDDGITVAQIKSCTLAESSRAIGQAAVMSRRKQPPVSFLPGAPSGESRARAIRQQNILASLSDQERRLFLARCTEQHFEPNANLFIQGARHVATFVIAKGLVRTYYSSPAGKEITLAYWSEGDLIGGPSFFDDGFIHVWSAKAVEPTSVLAISGEGLRELTLQIPKIGMCIIDALSFKLHWLSLVLQALGTESVCSRLAHLLIQLSALYGAECEEGIELTHHFTQEDLANMVGATRQWVSLTLGRFQRNGMIRVHKRRVVIRDLERLERMTT